MPRDAITVLARIAFTDREATKIARDRGIPEEWRAGPGCALLPAGAGHVETSQSSRRAGGSPDHTDYCNTHTALPSLCCRYTYAPPHPR